MPDVQDLQKIFSLGPGAHWASWVGLEGFSDVQGTQGGARPKGSLGACLGDSWGPAWPKRILKAK